MRLRNRNSFPYSPDYDERTGRVRRPRGSRFGWIPWWFIAMFLVVAALIVGGIVFGIAEVRNVKHVTFTVEDKTIKIDCDNSDNGNGCDSTYLIYTDHGVFKDVDSVWFWKFDSSDLYGKLHRGETYNCKTSGFRIHYTSNYPNLISCEEA